MKPYSPFRYFFLTIYYKLRILVDCTEGRGRLLYSEFLHYIDAIGHVWWEMPEYTKIRAITTIWGKFYFFGDLYSYLIMNPSFERPDMEYFVHRLRHFLKRGERILFLDIGANVGLYTVGLPTRVGKGKLTTHAFEPEPKYFSLLKKNIAGNNIQNIHLHHLALGDKNKTIESKEFLWPGHAIPKKKVIFDIRRLDDVMDREYVSRFDRVFIKIDIEGHEEEALRGASKFFRIKTPMLIMIEDCVRPSVQEFMQSNGFSFVGRMTPYNSFWELH